MNKSQQGGHHLAAPSRSKPNKKPVRSTASRHYDAPQQQAVPAAWRKGAPAVPETLTAAPEAVRTEAARSESASAPQSGRGSRPLLIACYVCLLLCFLTGAIEVLRFQEARPSETENRMLQGFPELSSDSFFSGTFMDELESYLSDSFFFRDQTASFTKQQLGYFALPDDGPDTWDVDLEHLDAPVADAGESAEENTPVELPSGEPAGTEESPSGTEEVVSIPVSTEIDISLLNDVELYLINQSGAKTNAYTISVDQVAAFAQILNDYRQALPDDGTLHFVIPPVSAIANNILVKGTYTGWGSNLEDELSKVADPGVYIYDVTDILTPYLTTERLYPTNDHHWQPFSASKVAEAMIRNQGLPPMDFYEYRYYVSLLSNAKPFYGDALRSLSLPADAVPVMEPVCPVKALKIRNFSETSPDVFIDRSKGGLMSYMGGMQAGPWRYFDSGFHTGRKAMLVTDSFGLTLAPFLVPYYDEILFVDLRESLFSLEASGGTIREYIEYFDVDDIYMISSAYNPAIVELVQSRLFKYLG